MKIEVAWPKWKWLVVALWFSWNSLLFILVANSLLTLPQPHPTLSHGVAGLLYALAAIGYAATLLIAYVLTIPRHRRDQLPG